MHEIVIIGSGFSSFVAYKKLKKFEPLILTYESIIYKKNFFNRRNLFINKFFNTKAPSFGNFKYILNRNTYIHDRLSLGGNTNIWGGFINIESLKQCFLNDFNNSGIKFNTLKQKINGYRSNIDSLRQLRGKNNTILNTKNYIEKYINGFVYSIEIYENYLVINYLNKFNQLIKLKSKKIFIGLSFPQLIDLLYRSKLILEDAEINLNEFDHEFKLSFDKKNFKNKNAISIKYDFLRSLKHYLGYQKPLDNISLPIPVYVDQNFYFNKKNLSFKLDLKNKFMIQKKNSINFGDSIHYCNLSINHHAIFDYCTNLSKNIIGISAPFVDQTKPGPIANDIVNNIWNNF